MAADPSHASGSGESPAKNPIPADGSPSAPATPRRTWASTVWASTGAALLLLVLLIVFILQNLTQVDVHFLGFTSSIPLGVALLIAAVGGGVVVAIAGAARVTGLRVSARRARRASAGD
jgi:uncharacterized integral membrane protein